MPDVRVLNELQIKKDGVVATYKLGTVNGYYNPTDGKFYEEVTHVTEIEGAPNLVYADIAGNALYIYKLSTSSFVKVSGEGGGSSDNLKFGYLNDEDGKFYEDDQYQVEIPGNVDYLFIGLDNDTIYRYDTSDTAFVAIGGEVADEITDGLMSPVTSNAVFDAFNSTNTNLKTWTQNIIGGLNGLAKREYSFKLTHGSTVSLTPNKDLPYRLPTAYLLITRGTMTNALNLLAGIGYGATSARHKTSVILGSFKDDAISMAIDNDTYGLSLTNHFAESDVNVFIVDLVNSSRP